MGNHTQVRASEDGTVDLSHTTTDSPILPAVNLQQLQQIDPSLVSFVVEQTKQEAEYRRSVHKTTNLYIFIERVSGVFAGALVAVFGLLAGAYCIIEGHDVAGAAICGVTLVAMVTVLVTKKKPDEESIQKPATKRNPRRK